MRVLIVEDSDSICGMIQALLSARGHEVRSASSGAKGLEEAFAWRPHAVLVDIHLPGSFDGLEVCERLQKSSQTSDVPILVISAQDDDETRRQATVSGAAAFYAKPFSPLALLKEIEALGRRSGHLPVK